MDTTRLSRCQATCWSLSALTGVLILWASAGSLGVIGALIVAVIVGLAMALLFTRLICTGHSADDPGIQPDDIKEMLKKATGVTFYKAPLDEEDLRSASPVMSAPAPTQAANNPGPAVSDAPRPDVGMRPEKLSAPRAGQADDLKQIKGIGPKLEALCHELGFYHFDQIARWTEAEVAWVDENLTGFNGRVSRDNWVAQAKTLAAGGETEFSRRQAGDDMQ